MTAVQDYVGDPKKFLHRINFPSGRFEFVELDRKTISDSTFLDDQTLSARARQPSISQTELTSQLKDAEDEPAPVNNFIFHIGFCCSTLLSRALEAPGKVLSLREPNIFHNLADFKRWPKAQTGPAIDFDEAFDIGLRLLNKPHEEEETVIVKTPNITNNLITDIMERNQTARAVLLYVPLKSFLASIVKKGEPGRAFSRKLFMKYRLDEAFRNSEYFKTPFILTDLQVTAFLWILQMQLFQQVVNTVPAHRVLALNAEHFLDNPAADLTRVAALFGLPLDKAHFDKVVSGPVFQTDSKKPGQVFSGAERARENRDIYNTHAQAFHEILKWSYPFVQKAGIFETFPEEA